MLHKSVITISVGWWFVPLVVNHVDPAHRHLILCNAFISNFKKIKLFSTRDLSFYSRSVIVFIKKIVYAYTFTIAIKFVKNKSIF